MVEWFVLGKNLNMSIVASIGYCIEVVGEEGQGVGRSTRLQTKELENIV